VKRSLLNFCGFKYKKIYCYGQCNIWKFRSQGINSRRIEYVELWKNVELVRSTDTAILKADEFEKNINTSITQIGVDIPSCDRLINGVVFSFFSFFWVGWDWVHLVRRPLIGLLYQPRMIDDDCGAVGGMRIGKRNRSTRRKTAPVSLYPPQISHGLTWARTRAAGVSSLRLTAWAMARPTNGVTDYLTKIMEVVEIIWKQNRNNVSKLMERVPSFLLPF
jgi:hypothetical protein